MKDEQERTPTQSLSVVNWDDADNPVVKLFVAFDVEGYVEEYELCGEDGDYCPNEQEKIILTDAIYGVVSNLHEALRKLIPSPAPEPIVDGWQPMETAPMDGVHVILAVRSGPFVYAVQGAYMMREWSNAANIKSEPLCWMPNVRIPAKFLPWTDEFKALATPAEGK